MSETPAEVTQAIERAKSLFTDYRVEEGIAVLRDLIASSPESPKFFNFYPSVENMAIN